GEHCAQARVASPRVEQQRLKVAVVRAESGAHAGGKNQMTSRAHADAELGTQSGGAASPRICRVILQLSVMPAALLVMTAAVARVVEAGVQRHDRTQLPGDRKPLREPLQQLAAAPGQVPRVARGARA